MLHICRRTWIRHKRRVDINFDSVKHFVFLRNICIFLIKLSVKIRFYCQRINKRIKMFNANWKKNALLVASDLEEAMPATRNSRCPARVAKTIRGLKMREGTVVKLRSNHFRNLNGPHCVISILIANQNVPACRKDTPSPRWPVLVNFFFNILSLFRHAYQRYKTTWD